MRLFCPACEREIPAENINIDEAIAKCECGEVFGIEGVAEDVGEIAPEKPAGTKIEVDESPSNELHIWIGGGFKPSVIGLIIFAALWNGFLIIFSFMMFFGGGWDADEGVFPIIFLIPFYLVGIGFIIGILWILFGKSSIHVNSIGIVVVKELFGLRKRKIVPLEIVGEINVDNTGTTVNNVPQRAVMIHFGKKTARFGTGLSEQERQWLAYEIKQFVRKLQR